MSRAVFLDRDGVINRERHDYVKTLDELEIFPNVVECIKLLKNAEFHVIVITNQSAINRGLTSHQNVEDIHSTIQKYLRQHGTSIDSFYYCPHRPDENCTCRKPKSGLLLKAASEFNIDLSSSWMIGDSDSDIEAAESIGCKGLKLGSGLKLSDAVIKVLESKHF